MQVSEKHSDDATSIAHTRPVQPATPISEESAHDHRGQGAKVLKPNPVEICFELAKVVGILDDGFLAQAALTTQVREKPWHRSRKGLTEHSTTRVANVSWHHQSQHLLDGPADLLRQAWTRNPRSAPVIRSSDPVTDECIDVHREIFVTRRALGLREDPKAHLNRYIPRESLGRVTTLNQPGRALLDRWAQP
jgi:hypothetical protein